MSTPPSATPVPGLRTTAQRTAVVELLNATSEFRTAQDVHEQLRHRGESIGLTTVYRTLQQLAEAGEIDVLRTHSGELTYRRCSPQHHHHLVCQTCGRTIEVAHPDIEAWAARVAAEHGFTELSHTVEILGHCPDCAP